MPQLPADSGRIVLWEHTRQWGRLFLNRLRRNESTGHIDAGLLAEQAVFVASVDELRAAVENHPASFVIAEVTVTHFRDLIGRIPQFRRTMPRLHVAIVCFELPELPVDEFNVLDSLFREAGATAVLATQRDLLAMLSAVLAYFANLPEQATDWHELIEQRLPWRNG